MAIRIVSTVSGKIYQIGRLQMGHHQYMDRLYQFDYVPEALQGSPHIMTCGDDKMISEDQPCFTVEVDGPASMYVLYPDKQPVLPGWLESWKRERVNVTRMDSSASSLKGYFSVYRRDFPAGRITFNGNSPNAMLREDWYVETGGNTYCMYTVAVREKI